MHAGRELQLVADGARQLKSRVFNRYCGPQPPDKTHVYTLVVYALDCKLGLSEGYYLNEFRRAIEGHVLAKSVVELPSRA